MDAVLGIDIAKAKFTVTLRTPDGKQRRKTCPNSPAGFEALAGWLTRQHVTQVHACGWRCRQLHRSHRWYYQHHPH